MNFNLSNSISLFLIITISIISGNFISSYLIKKSDQVSGRQVVLSSPKQPHHTNVIRPVMSNPDLCDFWKEHIQKNDNTRNRELLRRACSR